jgi:hypothetical protein
MEIKRMETGAGKGKVLEKHVPDQKNARGRIVGMPTVTVVWKE